MKLYILFWNTAVHFWRWENVGVNKPGLSRHCAVYQHLKVIQDRLASKWTNWHCASGLKYLQRILLHLHFFTLLLLKKHHVSQLIIPGWDNLVQSGKQEKWAHIVAVWFLFSAVNPCGSGALGSLLVWAVSRGHWLFWGPQHMQHLLMSQRNVLKLFTEQNIFKQFWLLLLENKLFLKQI